MFSPHSLGLRELTAHLEWGELIRVHISAPHRIQEFTNLSAYYTLAVAFMPWDRDGYFR